MLSSRSFEIIFSIATFAILSGLSWWQIAGLLFACGFVAALANEIIDQRRMKAYLSMPVPRMSLRVRQLQRSA